MKEQKDASSLFYKRVPGIRYRTDMLHFRSDLSYFNTFDNKYNNLIYCILYALAYIMKHKYQTR